MNELITNSKLSRLIIIFFVLNFFIVEQIFSQSIVLVPQGKPVMVDGKFSEQEWADAKTIAISEEVKLYFKQSEEYIYLGIEPPSKEYKGGWVDLYISGNDGEILNLHASRKLGERKLINGEWKKWSKWWTNEGSWRANYNRPNDIDENGESKVVYLKDKGWEYQIRKSKFKKNQWKIMFDISLVLKGFKSIKYPANTENIKSDNWLILQL